MGSLAPFAPALFAARCTDRLIWLPEIGVGYYPVDFAHTPYDTAYFQKYAAYAETPMGRALLEARIDFVRRHYSGPMVDVGIGSGAFVESRRRTYGYDVNPAGIAWLKRNHLWYDVWEGTEMEAVSLWDVLEHMPDFDALLARVSDKVFCCLPIFHGAEEALASHHFRRDEHCWYFSVRGFTNIMADLGWRLLEMNTEEISIGRSGIYSFAFERIR